MDALVLIKYALVVAVWLGVLALAYELGSHVYFDIKRRKGKLK